MSPTTPEAPLPTPEPDPLSDYQRTVQNHSGFILEDSPLRPRSRRMPMAAFIVSLLTVASLFGGIGYAIGSAI